MGFFEAVRTCLFQKYLDFRGRASRAEYWWFQVFVWLIVAAGSYSGNTVLSYTVFGIIALPLASVTVRRLHDTDRPGWWVLLVPLGYVPWVWGVAGLVWFWFMVQKGDPWENRYGPNPAPDTVLGLGRPGVPPPRHGD